MFTINWWKALRNLSILFGIVALCSGSFVLSDVATSEQVKPFVLASTCFVFPSFFIFVLSGAIMKEKESDSHPENWRAAFQELSSLFISYHFYLFIAATLFISGVYFYHSLGINTVGWSPGKPFEYTQAIAFSGGSCVFLSCTILYFEYRARKYESNN